MQFGQLILKYIWKCRGLIITKTFLKEKKVERCSWVSRLIIKSVHYIGSGTSVGLEQSKELRAVHVCEHLIYGKGAFQEVMLGQLGIQMERNEIKFVLCTVYKKSSLGGLQCERQHSEASRRRCAFHGLRVGNGFSPPIYFIIF